MAEPQPPNAVAVVQPLTPVYVITTDVPEESSLTIMEDVVPPPPSRNQSPSSFMPPHQLVRTAQFYEQLDFHGGVVCIDVKIYYPLYTVPLVPCCHICVIRFSQNYDSITITDYIFFNQYNNSYSDRYYCTFCGTPLFSMRSVE